MKSVARFQVTFHHPKGRKSPDPLSRHLLHGPCEDTVLMALQVEDDGVICKLIRWTAHPNGFELPRQDHAALGERVREQVGLSLLSASACGPDRRGYRAVHPRATLDQARALRLVVDDLGVRCAGL